MRAVASDQFPRVANPSPVPGDVHDLRDARAVQYANQFRHKDEQSSAATQGAAFRGQDGAIRDHCATTLLAHPHHDSPLLADLNLGK